MSLLEPFSTGAGMIVIEGPDGAGKSTLLDQLVRIFNLTRTKLGGPPANEVEGLARLTTVMSLDEQTPWIFDRLPMISELVYGPILRGSTRPEASLLRRTLQDFIQKYDPLVIICQSPTGKADAMVETEKSWKPKELRDQIKKRYAAILKGYMDAVWELNCIIPDGRLILYNHRTSCEWDLVRLTGRYVKEKRPKFWYPGE